MLTARGRENFGIKRKVADKEAVNGKENFVDQKMKAPRPGLCPPCSRRPLPSGSSTSIVALSSILGAGTFVKTQFIPRLAEISNLVNLKGIWSRSEEYARGAAKIAGKHFPGAECKWGDKGLEKIIADGSTLGVAVVLAGQAKDYQAMVAQLEHQFLLGRLSLGLWYYCQGKSRLEAHEQL